jgi:hypothetical protein
MIAHLEFECGFETCASEPGKFCRFLSKAEYYPSHRACIAFDEFVRIFEGEPQRCPQCLAECGKGEEP